GILLEPAAHERLLEGPAVVALAWQHLHPEMSHLVRRPVAGAHALRRMARVAGVGVRVVVDDAHVEHGPARERHGVRAAVDGLPGEVPVADPDEPDLAAVGQDRVALHVRALLVPVRGDDYDLTD